LVVSPILLGTSVSLINDLERDLRVSPSTVVRHKRTALRDRSSPAATIHPFPRGIRGLGKGVLVWARVTDTDVSSWINCDGAEISNEPIVPGAFAKNAIRVPFSIGHTRVFSCFRNS